MKTVILMAALFVAAASTAKADTGRCQNKNLRLTCAATYNFAENTWPSVAGPSATSAIDDTQPEYFDPARCEASVVLYTADGKFIANYAEDGARLNAFIESSGQSARSVFQDATLTAGAISATIPAITQGDIKTVSFRCSIEK